MTRLIDRLVRWFRPAADPQVEARSRHIDDTVEVISQGPWKQFARSSVASESG
jgi:hypothetical protein